MIIVQLSGGMGNQMGVYAAGRALSLQCGARLKLDLSGLERDSVRKFELDKYNIQIEIATPEEIKFVTGQSRFKCINIIREKIEKRFHIRNPSIYRGNTLSFDPSFFSLKAPLYITGYFPSIHYYRPIFDLLKKELSISRPLSQASQSWLGKVCATCSIAVHVRRGDYASNPKITAVHGVLDADYYQQAFKIMRNKYPEGEFFVFSDDPGWVRDNIKPDGVVHYVDCNDADNGYQDYWLMRNCKHHIIANSGFSRWAALFCEYQHQEVIRPARWLISKELNDEDIGPSSWILVDNLLLSKTNN